MFSERTQPIALYFKTGKRLRIALFALLFMPMAWIGTDAAVAAFTRNYSIGVDMQKITCLPYRFFLLSQKPFKPTLERGDMVMFHADIELFKTQFPGEDDIAKFIAAVPGDQIRITDDNFYVNGVLWDHLWLMSFLKAEPGAFDRAFVVPEGQYIVAATAPGSYDSRYWGTITQEQIKAYVRPIL
jgi:conjugal transfer pilin signal peptidase TrbI